MQAGTGFRTEKAMRRTLLVPLAAVGLVQSAPAAAQEAELRARAEQVVVGAVLDADLDEVGDAHDGREGVGPAGVGRTGVGRARVG